MVRRTLVAVAAIVAAGALSLPTASGQESGYRFRQIVDVSEGFDFFGFGCPAINSRGAISFNVTSDETGDGIVRADDGALTTIVDEDTAGLADLDLVSSINDRGQVSFGAVRDDENFSEVILVGDGGPLTTIADSEAGAFSEQLDDGTSGVFVFDNGEFDGVVDSVGRFRDFGGPSLNNLGAVAFTATLDSVEAGVFVSRGRSVDRVADTRGPYSFFDGAVLNDDGQVAFNGFLNDGGSGIFTGRRPAADKVVALGDTILGEMVISVQLCAEGLNNRGVVTFLATLLDGRSGVFTATPVRRR
jgi:hypothetical protein